MSVTVACRLTAPIPSAIATIAVRGPDCLLIAGKCLNKVAASQWPVGQIHFAQWPVGDFQEHVVVCRVEPSMLEIHCHGGVAVSNAILDSLQFNGCTIINSEDWCSSVTDHSMPNPREQLRRLCEQWLIRTTSERTAGILLDQADGALFTVFEKIGQLIHSGQWANAKSLINSITRWNDLGRHLVNPWQVVLAGPPNVGKSSLINALSGQMLAIVHHEAGTTRDWIEAPTQIDGWPVSLTDTAGIRQSADRIEQEGVWLATQRVEQADLVVLVVDATIGWTQQHQAILSRCRQCQPIPKILIAWNKCDLHRADPRCLPVDGPSIVMCSAAQDVTSLLASISQELVPETPVTGQPIVFDLRQQGLLSEMLQRLETPVAPASAGELKSLSEQLLSFT